MNTVGNSRKRDSRRKIESAFLKLMQTREINQISGSCWDLGTEKGH